MTKNPAPANDTDALLTVSDQILAKFYDALEKREEFKEIAARFCKEPARSDAALRKILFGDEA